MYYLGINTYCRYSVFTEARLSEYNYDTAVEAVQGFSRFSTFDYTKEIHGNRWVLTEAALYYNSSHNDIFTIIAKAPSLPEFTSLYPELFI